MSMRGSVGDVEQGWGKEALPLDRRCGLGIVTAMLLGSLLEGLFHPEFLLGSPVALLAFAFSLWMFVDALRRQEWIWAVCIAVFTVFSAMLYFFLVYRQQGPAAGGGMGGFSGLELPGARQRARMREIRARIHDLDHARDHLDLADLMFSRGKFKEAEASYRASLARDPEDMDAAAHLGQCLMRLGRPAEARPLLEGVLAKDPRHDYGHTRMALAEALTALGDTPASLNHWHEVNQNHGYPRARVQHAELLLAHGRRAEALALAREAVADDDHAPRFQRQRDKAWIRRARRILSNGGGDA